MYSAQVLDHFQNPRNAGDIEDADAAAELENPACGDVVRLSLRIREQRIVEARFKAKGCVASVSCASVLTVAIREKSLSEARSLNREDISSALGQLPPASIHAAQLAVDVLHAALRQFNR
ncbi:MAG TPA: iron-sulfur cluster assembly scaffold protein [Candidatus Sulfotelmatobacter sp.]